MSPRALIRGGVLTFAAVDPADEGEYSCKALNTHGEHTARVSLIVQSRFPWRTCRRRLVIEGWWLKRSFLCQRPTPAVSARSSKSKSAPKTLKSTKGTR